MRGSLQITLTILVALLVLFGVCMLYSTSYAAFAERVLARQLTWIALGSILAVLLRSVNYHILGKYSTWLCAGVSATLIYLFIAHLLHLFPIGNLSASSLPLVTGATKGAFRWLRLGPLSVQPSEFATLALLLYLSNYYHRHSRHLHQFMRGAVVPMGVCVCMVALILAGGNLSTAIMTAMLVLGVAFIAGLPLRYFVLAAVVGFALIFVVLKHSPTRMNRLKSFRDPEQFQTGSGYQLWLSQLALGSGGWRGLGFTNSRMKQHYLPEAHTDFIVAIIGEELGFIAVMALILLYSGVAITAFLIAATAIDRAGALLASGIGLSLSLSALINISVVSGLAPTTGVTAPFISYGGSSMIASLISVGLLLSIARVSKAAAVAAAATSSDIINTAPPVPRYRHILQAKEPGL